MENGSRRMKSILQIVLFNRAGDEKKFVTVSLLMDHKKNTTEKAYFESLLFLEAKF